MSMPQEESGHSASDQPPTKVRRVEAASAPCDVLQGVIIDVGSKTDMLESAVAGVAIDGSVALLLYHSADEKLSLTQISADAKSITKGAVRLVAFDVKDHYEANREWIRSHQPTTTSDAESTDATTEESPTKDGAAAVGLSEGAKALVSLSNGTPVIVLEDLVALPRMVLLLKAHRADSVKPSTTLERMLSKHVTSGEVVQASTLVQPVYTLAHLLRVLRAASAQAADQNAPSFSVMWMSAAWCPPCQRILAHLPSMIPQLPPSVKCVVKADMDLTQPIFDAFGVSIIPTFVVIDNKKLLESGESTSTFSNEDTAKDALVAARVDALQNSQQGAVMTFIEKHCATLQFGLGDDDDF